MNYVGTLKFPYIGLTLITGETCESPYKKHVEKSEYFHQKLLLFSHYFLHQKSIENWKQRDRNYGIITTIELG
jgi:hypothetical protein